jgi:hypothetical protein
MTFSVSAALDAYILAIEADRPFDGMWHPSAISGCQRKAIYGIRQVEPDYPTTEGQRRIFRIGHVWHEFFQAALSNYPGIKSFHPEVKVLDEELGITGASDGVSIFEDDTAEMIEVKTVKEWALNKLKKDGAEPYPEHLKQTKPYFVLLRAFGGVDENGVTVPPLGDRLKRVRFIYINKQTLEIKEFTVDWDPAWEQEVRELIAQLDSYRADPISLPPRLPLEKGGRKHWLCESYCEFRDRCWNQDPKEIPPDPDVY